MIYHYSVYGPEILRAGILRVSPVLVYEDFLGPMLGHEPAQLAPVVWFTRSPQIEGTVLGKQIACGNPEGLPHGWYRFGVQAEAAPLGLARWADALGYPPSLFRWMVQTAALVGSDWRDWRISTGDVPRSEWVSVEKWGAGEWVPAEQEEAQQ